MMRLSLKARTLGITGLTLLFFIPLVTVALENAFSVSLTDSMEEQLRVQNLGLISEFELSEGEILMPGLLFNEALNLPESGTYGFIAMHMLPAWQSDSAVGWTTPPQLNLPPSGKELFERVTLDNGHFFQFSYTAVFEDNGRLFPITFHLLKDARIFDAQVNEFRGNLYLWLGAIVGALILVLVWGLRAALKPVATINTQIQQIESGQRQQIDGHYPDELAALQDRINHLLSSQKQQRSRYRNSLSDLAHALKTPLAVLKGMDDLNDSARAQLQRIENQISRQLKRAVSARDAVHNGGIALTPIIISVIDAMEKVYLDKKLSIHLESHEDLRFYGDQTDVTELIGNLLDNACKAAQQQVAISARQTQHELCIQIEDDGPGVAPEQRQWLLQRGARLDAYGEGQGIGMAIVADLLVAYEGNMDISDSQLGGACFTLRFTTPPQ